MKYDQGRVVARSRMEAGVHRIIPACAAVLVTLAACSDNADPVADVESTVPSNRATVPQSRAPSPTETATKEPTTAETFEQPFLPDDQARTVELRSAIPIEPFDGATPEQLEVLDDASHAWAAWEQILWGVPFEETRAAATATTDYADHLRGYAQESIDLERVSIGDPMRLAALSVEISGDTAEIQICVDTHKWRDVFAGGSRPPLISDPLWLGTDRYVLVDGEWIRAGVNYVDDVSRCEGIFG